MLLDLNEHLRGQRVDAVLGAIDGAALRLLRLGLRAPRLSGRGVLVERLQLRSLAGYPIEVAIYRPAGGGARPAVVLCPDHGEGIEAQLSARSFADPRELAATGAVVAVFDPAGRGQSWGEDDFGGPEHQDNVVQVVLHLQSLPEVDRSRVGLLAIGAGNQAALGAARTLGAGLAWLIDYEGPADRETSAAIYGADHACKGVDDATWWADRAPATLIAGARCGYLRLQAEEDHRANDELRHAQRMLHAAAQNTGLRWIQINDHPIGERPKRPRWMPRGRVAARAAILHKLRAVTAPIPPTQSAP